LLSVTVGNFCLGDAALRGQCDENSKKRARTGKAQRPS
jgi:hypothetical protein